MWAPSQTPLSSRHHKAYSVTINSIIQNIFCWSLVRFLAFVPTLLRSDSGNPSRGLHFSAQILSKQEERSLWVWITSWQPQMFCKKTRICFSSLPYLKVVSHFLISLFWLGKLNGELSSLLIEFHAQKIISDDSVWWVYGFCRRWTEISKPRVVDREEDWDAWELSVQCEYHFLDFVQSVIWLDQNFK